MLVYQLVTADDRLRAKKCGKFSFSVLGHPFIPVAH
jgi:hypothetical protein